VLLAGINNMSNNVSPTFINNVKNSAKKIKKEKNINHSTALDLASNQVGYPSYHALNQTFKNQKRPQINYIQEVREVIELIIDSDHCTKVIKDNEFTLSKYHDTKSINDIKAKILKKVLDAFDNGINHDGQNPEADYQLLTSGFYNESIKELGHSMAKEDAIGRKVKGNLLVAVGHFFRSVHDCFQSQRFIHPSFNVYLSDWVRSVAFREEKVTKAIKEFSTSNEYVGLKNGSTYWKPYT
jgi:hypothetical protein